VLVAIALMLEVADISETSANFYQTTGRNNRGGNPSANNFNFKLQVMKYNKMFSVVVCVLAVLSLNTARIAVLEESTVAAVDHGRDPLDGRQMRQKSCLRAPC
jgi:hypothetical protein